MNEVLCLIFFLSRSLIQSSSLSLFLSPFRSVTHDAAEKSLTGIISTSQRVKTTVSTTYCIVILEFSTVTRGTIEPRAYWQ